MLTFRGWPKDGGLYTEYQVMRNDKEKIGVIAVGGLFTLKEGTTLTEEEKIAIVNGCKRVYELPSEYGCFGVGESPTEPFDERRLPGCIILAK